MSYSSVTLDMIYDELRKIRKELQMVEFAVIPVERLSAKELDEHKKALDEALKGERTNFRDVKG